jgi:hypothetical protein
VARVIRRGVRWFLAAAIAVSSLPLAQFGLLEEQTLRSDRVLPDTGRSHVTVVRPKFIILQPTRERGGLRLFENGVALGPGDAGLYRVRTFGAGAYVLRGSVLSFSSTDATDPATNGRTYTLRRQVYLPWAAAIAALLFSLFLAFPLAIIRAFGSSCGLLAVLLTPCVRRICSPVSHRTFLQLCIIQVVFFTLALFAGAVFVQPVQGDLTRIGSWSERDFGWRAELPAVLLRPQSLQPGAHQVLALGDSFSDSNIWQSLIDPADNISIQTGPIDEIGCPSDLERLMIEHPNVELFVVETVERLFLSRFQEARPCESRLWRSVRTSSGELTPKRLSWPLTLDANYVVRAVLNTLRLAVEDGRLLSKNTVSVALDTDRLFSNHHSERLLYIRDDEIKWGAEPQDVVSAARVLRQWNAVLAAHGRKMLFVLVPDKSTVYRQYFRANQEGETRYSDLRGVLDDQELWSVDLFQEFASAAATEVDFYLPNDTHLSTRGYRTMSNAISRRIKEYAFTEEGSASGGAPQQSRQR